MVDKLRVVAEGGGIAPVALQIPAGRYRTPTMLAGDRWALCLFLIYAKSAIVLLQLVGGRQCQVLLVG